MNEFIDSRSRGAGWLAAAAQRPRAIYDHFEFYSRFVGRGNLKSDAMKSNVAKKNEIIHEI